MIKRVAALIIGGGAILLGVFGQLSAPDTPIPNLVYATCTVGSVVGVLVVWWRRRSQEPSLTWQAVTGWAVLGGGVAGLVLGVLEWRMTNTLATGIGNGFTLGLLLSLVNYGIRGPLPNDQDGEG